MHVVFKVTGNRHFLFFYYFLTPLTYFQNFRRLLMKLSIISKDIRKENRTKILIKKRKFKKSLFFVKKFRFKLPFFLSDRY